MIAIPGAQPVALGVLKQHALRLAPGYKLAYVVDTAFHDSNVEKIIRLAQGADQLFIETAFLEEDAALAAERRYLTAAQAGAIARKAGFPGSFRFIFRPAMPAAKRNCASRPKPLGAAEKMGTSHATRLASSVDDRLAGEACNAQSRQACVSRGKRALDVDGTAGIFDHENRKPFAVGVFGRVSHAKIERETRKENAVQATLAQVTGKAGPGLAVILPERRIGIDCGSETFANNDLGMGYFQVVMEIGASRALHAVIGPQDLGAVVEHNGLERAHSRM